MSLHTLPFELCTFKTEEVTRTNDWFLSSPTATFRQQADVWACECVQGRTLICMTLSLNVLVLVCQGKQREGRGSELHGRSGVEKAWNHYDAFPVCCGNKMSLRQSNTISACGQAPITIYCYSIKNYINFQVFS